MQLIDLVCLIILISLFFNFLRFMGNRNFNKLVLLLSSLVIIEIHVLLFEDIQMKWLLLVFIGFAMIVFGLYGGVLSAIFASVILFLQTGERSILLTFSYLLVAVLLHLIVSYFEKVNKENTLLLTKLVDTSKKLNVLREVSISMQQTFQLQKLLQTILTAVTAGRGLGFNRAMILLVNEEGKKLKGILGTGPMSVEEGLDTWERLSKNSYRLIELIEKKETEKSVDQTLNAQVQKLVISLEESHFLTRSLESGSPLLIREIDKTDPLLLSFINKFNMTELAVFPLINQGNKVGVLIIDNPVNKRPITSEAMEAVIPLANQAAIAIQQSNLYMKIEEMAQKDGLTGLYNQRTFQKLLEQFYLSESLLSVIILDIDYFKHFNDTNGHLLGNQVLIELANVIQSSLKETELAFRFGGEEFVILLPNSNLYAAASIAEHIRRNVELNNFPSGEKQPNGRLTISLGVSSTKPFATLNAQELVDAADNALYKAKALGKNRVVVYERV
jgi:diguanylate cyclase (GGDEF)-like protein